jgi:hypothetical protein
MENSTLRERQSKRKVRSYRELKNEGDIWVHNLSLLLLSEEAYGKACIYK